jgi:Tail tubular protein
MQRLEVVNAMLATMGAVPLNTLEDPHAFRGACLSVLEAEDRRIQAIGWWANMENLTLNPTTDTRIPLPGDFISVRTPKRNCVQRGRFLYDLDAGTPFFTSSVDAVVIRRVPFADLPESLAQYIAAECVLKFQRKYDGDSTKTRDLERDAGVARAEARTDHIRNRRTNLLDSNVSLQRLKSLTRGARRFIRV